MILARKTQAKRRQNRHEACSQKASCKAPEPYSRGAAAAPTRGGVRESPSLGVTVAELARAGVRCTTTSPRTRSKFIPGARAVRPRLSSPRRLGGRRRRRLHRLSPLLPRVRTAPDAHGLRLRDGLRCRSGSSSHDCRTQHVGPVAAS